MTRRPCTLIRLCTPPRQHLVRKRTVRLVARRELAAGTGRATIVACAPPKPDPAAALAEATETARAADAAIVIVGTTEHDETEGHDRAGLSLGRLQNDLVRAIAYVDPRTVAVLSTWGPVELPWRDEVGALLIGRFPGPGDRRRPGRCPFRPQRTGRQASYDLAGRPHRRACHAQPNRRIPIHRTGPPAQHWRKAWTGSRSGVCSPPGLRRGETGTVVRRLRGSPYRCEANGHS